MTADNITLFLPIVGTVLATVIGGLTWMTKYFVAQISRKDEQLLKSLEVQQQSTTNGTVALQQAAKAHEEVRAVLEGIISNQADLTRAIDRLTDRMERTPAPRARRTS